jgi:hypothetical protein
MDGASDSSSDSSTKQAGNAIPPGSLPERASRLPNKLTRPAASQALVRPRLFQRLDASDGARVTWLQAPAGAGKTLLLASYVTERELQGTWLSIDVADRDVSRVFHYARLGLADVLQRAVFLPPFRPASGPALRAATRHFFELFFSELPAGSVCVLDDVHEALDEPSFAAVLRELCSVVPAELRLLIASRRAPPRGFARLLATGAMAVLTWPELRFDLSEVESLLQRASAAGQSVLAAATPRQILEQTEGWPVAVSLLASALRAGSGKWLSGTARPPALPEGGREAIFDFLFSEVLDHLSEGERELLLELALLPNFDAAGARQVSQRADAARLLQHLSRDLLLLEVDAEGRYRCHPLLRELLLERGREHFDAERQSELLVRSAQALAASDDFSLAVQLLARAEDWLGAVALIERTAPLLAGSMQLVTLARALETLPAAARSGRPWLDYWQAVTLIAAQATHAGALAEQAFETFSARNDLLGRALCWMLIVQCVICAGQDFRPLRRWLRELSVLRAEPLAPWLATRLAAVEFSVLSHYHPGDADPGAAVRFLCEIRGPLTDEHLVVITSLALYYQFYSSDEAQWQALLELLRRQTAREPKDVVARLALLQTEAMYGAFCGADIDAILASARNADTLARATGFGSAGLVFAFLEGHGALVRAERGKVMRLFQSLRIPASAPRPVHGGWAHYLSLEAAERGDCESAEHYAARSLALAEAVDSRIGRAASWANIATIAADAGNERSTAQALQALATATPDCAVLGVTLLRQVVEVYTELRLGRDVAQQLPALFDVFARSNGLTGLLSSVHVMRPVLIALLDAGFDAPILQQYVRVFGTRPGAEAVLCPRWPWSIRVRTFGRLEIDLAGEPLTFGRKLPTVPLALLELLALHTEPVPTDRVLRALWPGGYAMNAPRAALDSTVYRLRQLLGSDDAVEHAGKSLSLSRTLCWSDARGLQELRVQVAATVAGESGAPVPTEARVARWERLLGELSTRAPREASGIAALERLHVRWAQTAQQVATDLTRLKAQSSR